MSGHADTIRAALEFWQEDREIAAARAALDAMEAENQRLRDLLKHVEDYINDLAYPGPETRWIDAMVHEALAGDAE